MNYITINQGRGTKEATIPLVEFGNEKVSIISMRGV